jgi:hypothetical protein
MRGALKARVHGGRLVMDEPTELPEGAVINMVAIDGYDDLDDEEREALHASIDEGLAEIARGEEGVDAAVLLAELRALQ